MPLPIVAATLVGSIIAGLTQFFASRIGMILAGMGMTYIGVKGMTIVAGYLITDMQGIITWYQSNLGGGVGGQVSSFGMFLFQLAGYAGFFDAVNIIISGYMAYFSLAGLKVVLSRLNGNA